MNIVDCTHNNFNIRYTFLHSQDMQKRNGDHLLSRRNKMSQLTMLVLVCSQWYVIGGYALDIRRLNYGDIQGGEHAVIAVIYFHCEAH